MYFLQNKKILNFAKFYKITFRIHPKNMNNQQLKFILFFLFGLSLSAIHAQNMYVETTSGSQTVQSLTNIRKFTFSNGNLLVNNTANVVGNTTFALSDIRYISFKDLTLSVAVNKIGSQSIFVYPNPALDVLHIGNDNLGNFINQIEIINLEGKVIKKQTQTNTSIAQIEVNNLSPGFYFCKISSNKSSQTIKFFKQ